MTSLPDEGHEARAGGDQNLQRRSAVGFAWTMGGLLLAEPIRVLITATLARILTPSDFGVVAMAAVFIGLIAFANDFGFTVALIQKKHLTDQERDSVFWLSLAVGLFLTLIGWVIAPVLAGFYRDPSIIPVIRGLSLSFTLTSLFLVQGALVRRKMDFRTPAVGSVWGMIANGVVSISGALMGFGPMSIVAGTISSLLVLGVYVQMVTRYVPKNRPSWSGARETVVFGATVTAGDLAMYGAGNVDNLLVGRVLGSTLLGEYAVAYNLVTYPVRRIAKMATAVTLPAFSAIKSDRERFKSAYSQALAMALVVLWPILLSAAVVGEDLVLGLYGGQWVGAVAPFRILCIASMALVGAVFGELLLKSIGRPHVFASWAVVTLGATTVGVLLTTSSGIVAVAWAVALIGMIASVAIQVISAREIHLKASVLLVSTVPPLLASVMAAASCYLFAVVGHRFGIEGLLLALPAILLALMLTWGILRRVPIMKSMRKAEDVVRSLRKRRSSDGES